MLQFRLAYDLGYNKLPSTEAGQLAAAEEYRTTRRGRRRCLSVARIATASLRVRAAGFGAVSPWLQSAGRADEV